MSSFARRAALAASLLVPLAVLAQAADTPAAPAPAPQVALQLPTARVGGLWCGDGLLHEFSLQIAQHASRVNGKLVRKGRERDIVGHVEGSIVHADQVSQYPDHHEKLDLEAVGDQLRVTAGTGILALLRGQSFRRAAGAVCSG